MSLSRHYCSSQLSAFLVAGRMTSAFEERGALSFLTPADETNNAVLWCSFCDASPLVPRWLRRLPFYATTLASRRADDCGVQFDVASELAKTIFVTSDTVVAQLEKEGYHS